MDDHSAGSPSYLFAQSRATGGEGEGERERERRTSARGIGERPHLANSGSVSPPKACAPSSSPLFSSIIPLLAPLSRSRGVASVRDSIATGFLSRGCRAATGRSLGCTGVCGADDLGDPIAESIFGGIRAFGSSAFSGSAAGAFSAGAFSAGSAARAPAAASLPLDRLRLLIRDRGRGGAVKVVFACGSSSGSCSAACAALASGAGSDLSAGSAADS
eukprot:scaffold1499_cov255-Pinguiococcus_pyrenoidosus.AAC.35